MYKGRNMVVADVTYYTVEAFETYALHPDNRHQRLELITGEMMNVVSHPRSSEIAGMFLRHISNFVYPRKLGRVTDADGGYSVGNDRYMPDVVFLRHDKTHALIVDGYITHTPDLAVEVLSPTDNDRALVTKVANYMAHGTVVWVVDPQKQTVHVYEPAQTVRAYTVKDTLNGGQVLEGFTLALQEIFE